MKTEYKTVLIKAGKTLAVILLTATLTYLQANYVELIRGMVANEALAGTLIIVLRTAWSFYDMKKAV
jgi:hypothetical protein